MTSRQPVIFLSHGGGPSYFLSAKDMPSFKGMDKDSKAADFLRNLVKSVGLNRPEAILVLSAHWEENVCTVNTATDHSLYFDYYNFPPETYKISWPVKGLPSVANKVKRALESKGIQCEENSRRGLDHGVFVPLKLVFPQADIPVCQLSLFNSPNIEQHLKIAEALADLRHEGILIIGSGFATHSVGKPGSQPLPWAMSYRKWLNDVMTNDRYTPQERKALLADCLEKVPEIRNAHPTLDHFIPLIMCSAVAGYTSGRLLYSEFITGSLLNEHYLF